MGIVRRFTWVAVLVALVGGLLAAPGNATALGSEGKIAFVRANQIYTMTKAGGSVTQLTTTGKNYRPRWSPDGRRIAYVQEDAAGRKNVFVMSASGTNKKKVTTSGTVNTAAVWSPDGKTLAFAQQGRYVFTPSCGATCFPAQEPREVEGNYVFLVRSTAPFGAPGMLQTYQDGGGGWRFYEPITAYPGTSMSWSPDGDDLAVVNGDSQDSPDTGMHLVHGMRGATAANAATGVRLDEVIWITGGDCCGYQEWSDVNYVPNGVLGWSTVDEGEFPGAPNPRVFLDYPGFVSQQGDKAGTPSPNGKNMVFVRTVGGSPTIWTATIKGASRKQIRANGYQPDWQPLP